MSYRKQRVGRTSDCQGHLFPLEKICKCPQSSNSYSPLIDKGKSAIRRRSNTNSRHDLVFSSLFALTNLIKVGKRRRI
jgi:hypothetical protein